MCLSGVLAATEIKYHCEILDNVGQSASDFHLYERKSSLKVAKH